MNANLSEIKRERKHLEQDAQMLANRIKLLQLEDEKTWKKIKETKRKARQFALVKQEQEEKMMIFREFKQERGRAISEKRSHCRAMREYQQKEKEDLKSALFRSKYEDAILIKHQRDSISKTKKSALEISGEENRIRKNVVKRDRQMGKMKIIEFQQKKNAIGREMYWQKIAENEKIKHEKIKELSAMEALEIQLIKKLENTQFLHEHANNELQNLLKSTGASMYPSISNKKHDLY